MMRRVCPPPSHGGGGPEGVGGGVCFNFRAAGEKRPLSHYVTAPPWDGGAKASFIRTYP
jgi:hypothetical protein